LTPSAIPTFGVEADSTVNGAASAYFVTWYSEIAAFDGDEIVIPFPAETSFAPGADDKLACTAVVDSLEEVSCTFKKEIDELISGTDRWKYGPEYITSKKKTVEVKAGQLVEEEYKDYPDTYNVLVMTLTKIKPTKATGLYKVRVEDVKNPASRRRSSPFGRIVHRTSDEAEIAEYRVQKDQGSNA
jgi:hypothetical protein